MLARITSSPHFESRRISGNSIASFQEREDFSRRLGEKPDSFIDAILNFDNRIYALIVPTLSLRESTVLAYLIRFDEEKGKFVASSSNDPSKIGEGDHLFAAIEDLEKKISTIAEAETIPSGTPLAMSRSGKLSGTDNQIVVQHYFGHS